MAESVRKEAVYAGIVVSVGIKRKRKPR